MSVLIVHKVFFYVIMVCVAKYHWVRELRTCSMYLSPGYYQGWLGLYFDSVSVLFYNSVHVKYMCCVCNYHKIEFL